jgi:adenylate kinase
LLYNEKELILSPRLILFLCVIDEYRFMFNLVLFGPPGSGKGTQSANIVRTYGLRHISTGDLLRDEVSGQTPLGVEAKKYMDQGLLVPDEVVIGMISSKIDEYPEARGFIFDGFPRTKAQAESLDNLLEFKNTQIHLVLSLDVPQEELTRRMIGRGVTSGRTDDTADVITRRIEEYRSKTAPVAEYYDLQGKLEAIRGDQGIDETFHSLSRQIDKHLLPVA